MPLTSSGKKILDKMKKQYGESKGTGIFYSSINDNKKGSDKWHNASANSRIYALAKHKG